jgi:CubicO group peptidase (beta-lactamase class C family)
VDEATLAAVDRWLAYRTWHSRVPGVQVAVGVRGEVLLARSYGYADLEQGVRLRDDHLFRIASHSKTFTATLVLQLFEQGRLGLEDPVAEHLPELADGPLGGMRVRELLEHTGGVLRDGLDSDYWQFERAFPDRAALLALVREGGSKGVPGETFAYSNLGYSLLGLVVEAVTGVPYAQAVAERITTSLGLTDTAADYLSERSGDYAAGHSGLHQTTIRHRLDHIPTGAMAAATGFTSTARDLVAYFAAHAYGDERLLSDRTKRLQQRAANVTDPADATGTRYGWGMILDTVDDQELVGHSGGYPGHITKTFLDPATGLVVSVLTNAIDGPAALLARGVVQLLARARERPGSSGDEPLSEAALARTGRYASLWQVLDVAALGGRLQTLHPTAWAPLELADELEDLGDGRFRISGGSGFGSVGELVTFEELNEAVTGLRYGGMSMRRLSDLEDARTD